jgi:hypothetical protein
MTMMIWSSSECGGSYKRSFCDTFPSRIPFLSICVLILRRRWFDSLVIGWGKSGISKREKVFQLGWFRIPYLTISFVQRTVKRSSFLFL